MKWTFSAAALALLPSLAKAFTRNSTAVPGVIETVNYDDGKARAQSFAAAAVPPDYTFNYGDSSDACNTVPYVTVTGNSASPCSDFMNGPPGFVVWDNPVNPDTGLSYWNMILYFEGDECPVVGHPIQCDSPTYTCLRFAQARPLSYNIVEAASGIRHCDFDTS